MDSDLDYSAQMRLTLSELLFRIFGLFYGSIVSQIMSEKIPFVSHGKQSKYYMISNG